MAHNERHGKILSILKQNGKADVHDLAHELFVSEATIRRDLSEMQRLGLIERSHGGAILPDNRDEVSIFVRMNKNSKEKERAATAALSNIPEFRSVFIDSSSTALALAQRMDLEYNTVVTNNLETAIQLSKKKNINLIILGGSVQYNTVSATGSFTARQLDEFSFDLMICSCAAVSGSEALERSLEQKEIKSAAMHRAKYRILVFDSTKYSEQGIYKIGLLSDFQLVATDKEPAIEIDVGKARLVY